MLDDSTASLAWILLALGSGTLLVYATAIRFRNSWWVAIIALALLAIAAIGGASHGRAIGIGIVAALAGVVVLVQWFQVNDDEPLRKRRLILSAIIAGGISCGAFIGSSTSGNTPGGAGPILVLDPASERAELLAEVNAARLEVELILERDLPAREQSAREAQDWKRLELLARVRARAQQDHSQLLQFAIQLEDVNEPPPDPEEIQALLAGLERLLGAVRMQR